MTSRLAVLSAALSLLAIASAGAFAADNIPTIDHPWARATPSSATTGAAYLTIVSPAADKLLAVSSPIAGRAEIHNHVDDNGVMRMRPVRDGLELPAMQKVELKPNGLHVMLMGLKQPLKEGDSFPLTLSFENAAPRIVMVQVEKLGAMGPAGQGHAADMHDMQGMHDHDAMGHDHMTHTMTGGSAGR
jgi:copper(I)-binding protein